VTVRSTGNTVFMSFLTSTRAHGGQSGILHKL